MKKQDILIRALPTTPSGGGCHLRIQRGIVLKAVASRWRGKGRAQDAQNSLIWSECRVQRRLEDRKPSLGVLEVAF